MITIFVCFSVSMLTPGEDLRAVLLAAYRQNREALAYLTCRVEVERGRGEGPPAGRASGFYVRRPGSERMRAECTVTGVHDLMVTDLETTSISSVKGGGWNCAIRPRSDAEFFRPHNEADVWLHFGNFLYDPEARRHVELDRFLEKKSGMTFSKDQGNGDILVRSKTLGGWLVRVYSAQRNFMLASERAEVESTYGNESHSDVVTVSISDFVEPAPGVFVPTVIKTLMTRDGKPMADARVKVMDIRIDPGFNPSFPPFSIPAGATVLDSTRKRVFVAQADGSTRPALSPSGRELRHNFEPTEMDELKQPEKAKLQALQALGPAGFNEPNYLFWGVIGAAAVSTGLAFFLIRRRRLAA